MSEITIRTSARLSGGNTLVKALIQHPSHSGISGADAQGKIHPAYFLTEVQVELNGEPVALVHLGPGVAHEPLFAWRIAQAKAGDRIRVVWRNNRNETGAGETVVK